MARILPALFALSALPAIATAQKAVQADVPPGWLESVSENIRLSEYAFAPRPDGAWTTPNRAQELRVRVVDGGVEVFPRATSWSGVGADWKTRLATVSFGRLSDPLALGAPAIAAEGNTLHLVRPTIGEWFVNDERGLEQGWTIHERPAGIGDDPLWIGLAVSGDLSLRIAADGLSATLHSADGALKLRYHGLAAWDANGAPVDARLGSGVNGVGIRVQDSGATYPLTIDPVISGPTWITESNQASAAYGISVAAAGDVDADGFTDLIIGASLFDNGESEEGQALLYLGTSSGPSTTSSWSFESDVALAELGRSVSSAGDVNGDGFSDIIVGAPNYTDTETDEGAAYLFFGSSTGPSLTADWFVESGQATAEFGTSVCTAGDVNDDGFSDIIVGAPLWTETLSAEGRAFLYLGSLTGPSTTADWTTDGGQADARYGISVATAGDVNDDGFDDVGVGADRYDNPTNAEGAAFVFHGSATVPSLVADWSTFGVLVTAEYGASVYTAGDVNGDGFADFSVGAPGLTNVQLDEGRAFVYHGSSTGLSLVADWMVESNNVGARLGSSLGTAGDVNGDGYSDMVVGAPNFSAGQASEGLIAVYLGSASGLSTTATFTLQSNQAGAMVGVSVGTAGDANGDGYSDVVVGASGFSAGQAGEGRAFLFLGNPEGTPSEVATLQSDQDDAHFATSLACAGDVNGDGFSDVIVGAPDFDNGEVDEGRAFVFHGSASGLSSSADWTAETNQAGAQFGFSVAGAGDVNNDGFGDVVVGAPGGFYLLVLPGEGQAALYLGSGSGLATTPAWSEFGQKLGALFGSAVSGAGDVNGDGFADVLVGAPGFDESLGGEGAAFVHNGYTGGLLGVASWKVSGTTAGEGLGAAVACAGDVNGDGFSDILIGSPGYDNGEADEGAAFVFHGSKTGPGASADWTVESNQAGAAFGSAVDSAGDINGDCFSDVVVGAPNFMNVFADEGRATAYLGSLSGLSTTASWTVNGAQASGELGSSVAGIGDVNNDGFGDLAVGAPLREQGELDEGQAFFFLGAASGPSTSPTLIFEGGQVGAEFGTCVSAAGDVDGDGFADFIVGAPLFDDTETDEGRMSVFHGNLDEGSRIRGPLQLRSNGSKPVALLGQSDSPDSFSIAVDFPEGIAGFSWASPTTTAFLEWEIKPIDMPLDGTGLEQSAVGQVITNAALPLSFEESVMRNDDNDLPYHWRARIVTDNPLFPTTQWFALPGNTVTEAKIRFPDPNTYKRGFPSIPVLTK